MEITLDYWNPRNETVTTETGFRFRDTTPIITSTKVLSGSKESIFKKFYDLNNSLRYCNGSYYKFQDKQIEREYNEWYKSLSETTRFQMYYGNGVVD